MNVLFLVPYPLNESPSQRFRFEQYFELILQEGHSYSVQSFLEQHNWRDFSRPGKLFSKLLTIIKGFAQRISILPDLRSYHFIFIHREAAPLGPPVLEWIIARVLKKRIIYDFDDAIWLTDQASESTVFKALKWRSKVASICRWSYRVSCGNSFLCDYARKYNRSVVLNPTTIDTSTLHVANLSLQRSDGGVTIGWTGSRSTLKYLVSFEPVLRELQARFAVAFLVIADENPGLHLEHVTFRPWNVKTEIEDLRSMDIGIMPLPQDEWSKGKCGFKALQYMALEIPTVASKVGANTSILDHGTNGFLASTHEEWIYYLTLLIESKSLRQEIGRRGRQKVINQFSVEANKSTFLSLFR